MKSQKIAGINYPPYVESVQAGENVTIDQTDAANPKVNASGGGGGGSNVTYYIGDLTVISADTYSLTDVYNTTGRTATMIDNGGDIGVILDGVFNPNYMATASLVSTNAKANFCYSIVPFEVEIIGVGVSNFESGNDAARICITIFED